MLPGSAIPFKTTGGCSLNSSSGSLDFILVASSQVTALGNFIISRAAMLTF